MKELDYTKRISDIDEYLTPHSKFRRKLFPSFCFFSNLLRILIYSNRQARKGIYNSIRWANSSIDVAESLERSGVKFHFYGMLNLKKVNGPVVLISNHMSTLETMVLPSLIQPQKEVVFVIKEELSRYPVFGTVALARDPILVGRENPREDLKIVLEDGSARIQKGKSVIIFPQRTRKLFFESVSFNSLGIKLAKRNNVPVIPVALISDAWGNGKLIKEVGKIDPSKEVKIAFGEPIQISGNGSEEHQKVIEFIKNKFIEWGKGDLVKQ